MSFAARVQGAVRRRRQRLYYEHLQPGMPLSEIQAELIPGLEVDLNLPDGFQRLWSAHLATTPGVLWSVTPPATPDAVARAKRGEARVLSRTRVVTPDTDWHSDPFHEVPWPRVHVESCPYSVPGADLVLLWQLNRMPYVVDHAAAYRTSRDTGIADRVHALMASWARANPYLVGANWISPMETGLRLFAWSISLAGMTRAPVPDSARCELILRSVLRQARFLASHFSRWVIPNNHLIGEAALLSAFAAYWPVLKSGPEWTKQAETTLVEEARRQVLADGFHFENSVNYHLVVLDYFLVYLHARLIRGDAPDPFILQQTQGLADAALALVSPSGRMPMIGDDSMPHFVILGGVMGSTGPVSEHVTFEKFLRAEHARLFTTTPWGRELLALRRPVVHARRFKDAGIDVVRDEHSHIVFTHGPQHRHVFSNGHLHADAGSFELELFQTHLVVDSGTYLYGGPPGLRPHMRGARAHNTVTIDGIEPMNPTAAFQWESVSSGEALAFGAVDDVMVTGCRRRLPGLHGKSVDHVRALARVGSTVMVVDSLSPRVAGTGVTHSATLHFHTAVAPGIAVAEGRRVRLTDAGQFVRVFEVLDEPRATVDLIDNPLDPASLYSPMYGEVMTGTTIRVTVPVEHAVVLVTVLRDPAVSVSRVRTREGHIGCAIEDGHRKRILSLRLDPFAAHIGGRPVTGVPEPAPARRATEADSLEWLNELDA